MRLPAAAHVRNEADSVEANLRVPVRERNESLHWKEAFAPLPLVLRQVEGLLRANGTSG